MNGLNELLDKSRKTDNGKIESCNYVAYCFECCNVCLLHCAEVNVTTSFSFSNFFGHTVATD